jgi:hypothetical protein
MSITKTIKATSAGSNTGPFTIYHDSITIGNVLVSGVTRSSLLDGVVVSNIPDTTNTIIVQSNGECTNSESFSIFSPVSGLTWSTSTNTVGLAGCTDAGWEITNSNLDIKFKVSDSQNCGGTCSATQTGVATATITVGPANTYLHVDFNGLGERQDSNYDKITFKLDGTQIADAHAPGGGLGCLMGPVVKAYQVTGPYLLLANTVHTLRIDFTTVDSLYHVGSFYQVNLSFT